MPAVPADQRTARDRGTAVGAGGLADGRLRLALEIPALADVAFLAISPRRADREVGSQCGVAGVGGRADQVHGGGYGSLGFQAARVALTLGDHRILEGAPQEVVVAGGIGREQQGHRAPEHLPDRVGGELGGRAALL